MTPGAPPPWWMRLLLTALGCGGHDVIILRLSPNQRIVDVKCVINGPPEKTPVVMTSAAEALLSGAYGRAVTVGRVEEA